MSRTRNFFNTNKLGYVLSWGRELEEIVVIEPQEFGFANGTQKDFEIKVVGNRQIQGEEMSSQIT